MFAPYRRGYAAGFRTVDMNVGIRPVPAGVSQGCGCTTDCRKIRPVPAGVCPLLQNRRYSPRRSPRTYGGISKSATDFLLRE